ncbi:MAG: hypothetical protein RLZZ488_1869 [Pseudomonadota bacterium]|jgi:hypothetical protein
MRGLKVNGQLTHLQVSLISGLILLLSGCAETGYTAVGKSKAPPKKKAATPESVNATGLPVERGAKVFPGGENVGITFSGDTALQSAASEAETWIVTGGEVTRIKLDEAAGWPQTKWQMVDDNGNPSSSSGHRTYVSELGLLIGRTGSNGGIWLASDKNPGKAIPIFKPTDQRGDSRLSVTSFKVGSQPYIGFAYGTTGGQKKFVRIPIDKSKPNGIDIARKEEKTFGNLNQAFGGFSAVGSFAAYGSFMDQKSKAFFLGANYGGMWGVNVEKLTELTSQDVPNVGTAGRKVCNYTMSTTGNVAYALAGDLNGNVVTSNGAYTFAHDPVNEVVIGSSGGSLTVAKSECVAANGPAECTQANNQCAVINPAEAGSIGPISAVGDGRVVGIVRGGTSQVFVMSVNDKNDLSKGLTVKKVADIDGNAYMYNDFTGLTLYAPDQIKVIEFSKLKGYQPGKPLRYVAAGWTAATKKTEDLRGLKIEIVCYKKGGQKGPYTDQTKQLTTSASLFVLDPKVCGGDVDTLEVKVSSDGSTNNFSRLSLFEMRGAQ